MTDDKKQGQEISTDARRASRRRALGRLGLGAAAVYLAPTVTRLDSARAAFPSNCAGGGSKPGPTGGGGGAGCQ
ncbi:MAG: hypothetical protein P1U65_02215 [Minwuia sp.]|nr:hypothetical protein [Minwuia sp.]